MIGADETVQKLSLTPVITVRIKNAIFANERWRIGTQH